MPLQTDSVIGDRYVAQERLGVGAMGQVWSGTRLDDGEQVAIKVLLSGTATNPEVVARFKREAQVLALVKSDYVSRVLDFFGDPDFGLILVMELIQGESMLAMLQRAKKLPIEAALELGADIVRGLKDLHDARIVHRDLKPGNIVLRPMEGRMPQAVLIDFGMSRILSGGDPDEEVTAITRGDRVLGTLEYIAPEQVLISRNVSGAADLYALGCILFRAIAGHHVFGDLKEGKLVGEKLNTDPPLVPTGRDDEVSKRTQALVNKLLARRLRERYQKAEEVLADIEAILALAHPSSFVPSEQEQEELKTVFRPMMSLKQATAQAMRETVEPSRAEGAPAPAAEQPPPPPEDLSGITVPDASQAAKAALQMAAATREARQEARSELAAPASPVSAQPPVPASAAAPRESSGSGGFKVAVLMAALAGCLAGWLLFRQLQSHALLPGSQRSLPAAVTAP